MAITVETVGRRHYFRGNTFAVKDALRSAGCKWDSDARAWYTGKRETAEKLVAQFADTAPAEVSSSSSESLRDDSAVIGRARYKGREYLVVWEGETKRGRAAKLAFTDGSRVFWADASEVQVTKRYESREWRGREQPMTFGRLRRLREEYSAQQKAARDCALVGERGEYTAQYEADRHDRTPQLPFGTAAWLRHGQVRLAVVLVGYEPATYVRSEDAEDMGHYDVKSGWYGTGHYRAATIEEYQALQAESPRADGTCFAVGEAVTWAISTIGMTL